MPQRVSAFARAVTIAITAASTPLAAQDEDLDINDAAAYFAITTTPVGALPGTVDGRLPGAPQGGVAFRALLGYLDETGPFSRRAYGLSVSVPAARSTVTFTGGFLDFACDEDEVRDQVGGSDGLSVDCKGGFMAGADWAVPMISTGLGATNNAAFTVGVETRLGYSSYDVIDLSFTDFSGTESIKENGTSLAASLGIPLAISAASGALTLTPHLTPQFAFGRVRDESEVSSGFGESDEITESGSRFMLGGGLGVLFGGSGLGLDVGFHRVFFKNAKTVIGVGLRFGMR